MTQPPLRPDRRTAPRPIALPPRSVIEHMHLCMQELHFIYTEASSCPPYIYQSVQQAESHLRRALAMMSGNDR